MLRTQRSSLLSTRQPPTREPEHGFHCPDRTDPETPATRRRLLILAFGPHHNTKGYKRKTIKSNFKNHNGITETELGRITENGFTDHSPVSGFGPRARRRLPLLHSARGARSGYPRLGT